MEVQTFVKDRQKDWLMWQPAHDLNVYTNTSDLTLERNRIYSPKTKV
jgi:hypothetical protein